MEQMIAQLQELSAESAAQVGGKALGLGRMLRDGLAVPPGFVIGVDAFSDEGLRPEAWAQTAAAVAAMRRDNPEISFAVRSSAVDEDSQAASFAGEFESVLNVKTDGDIKRAVDAVLQSQHSARVAAYREARAKYPQGTLSEIPNPKSQIAVIVQQMIPAVYAGVLFTVDPVSGSRGAMSGSFVSGLGEKLVSGAVDGRPFTLQRPSGAYEGPAELEPYARELFQTGQRLENLFGGPQDIEWAAAGGDLFLLQARPVTTMQAYDPVRGDWNDSRTGDYLWSNSNFGEAFPDVMTPLTWSLVRIYAQETFGIKLPGGHALFGNIGGRLYMNLSLFKAIFQAFGMSRERMNYESEEFFGRLPDDIDIPDVPMPRMALIARWVPFSVKAIARRRRNLRRFAAFTAALPQKTADLQQAIAAAGTPRELAALWRAEFEPLLRLAYQTLQAGTSNYENTYRPLQRQLVEQVGAADANLLLSDVSARGQRLESLGPLMGLWQMARGEMAREDYLQAYGHRGPHEMELSFPRPAEDPRWLEEQLAGLDTVDVPALLAGREAERRRAWQRYENSYPQHAQKISEKLAEAAAAARARERIRSEETRLFGAARDFALKAGEQTGLGEDVFYLWLEELLALLDGDDSAVANIPARRAAHARLAALPPYPALISGRFDPLLWARDPARRSDLYEARPSQNGHKTAGADDAIGGYPGSAGVAEGFVRLLYDSAQGHLLQEGEVLVAATTNVGWTPLFPRAAAVVTDVGAPLSHAAIVARELGIPAVVGTGDATMRLRTGDRVRVDGAMGVVEKLS